ncbi:MAG: IS481 family transposase [Terriglobales bacterium]
MEERFQFIQEYRSENWSFAELCRRRGVSRKTGYKWLARYQQEGAEGLRDQSRAPQEHPNQILAEVAEAVVDLRREHPLWGPEKLRARLQRTMPEILWPAPSTIGELLKRRGMTVPVQRHRRAGPSLNPLSHVQAANQVWCVDFKGWFRCGDGSRCDPLTLTDAHSRYLLRCQALAGEDGRSVRDVMEGAFREYGLPEALRSDNGEPFASPGVGGLSRLSVWWLKLGIRPERIPRGKPQHNGRHERMHRTLKAATARPPAGNLRMQQQAFDAFQREYNEERPHEALQMKTPCECYAASSRRYPSRLAEPEYDGEWEVRRVRECGRMRWWSGSIFVGKALVGELVGLEPQDEGIWRVWFCGYPIGLLNERKGKIQKLDPGAEPDPAAPIQVAAETGALERA